MRLAIWKRFSFLGSDAAIMVFLVLLFLVLRLPFIGHEYGPEEPLWITAAEGVIEFGYPVASLGADKEHWPAYWKPPLLPMTLGASFALFGSSEVVSRSTMLFFSVLQLFLIWLLARRIFGIPLGSKIALLTIAILTIGPFFIQNSTYIESDGSILSFLLLALLFFAWPIVGGDKADWRSWAAVFGFGVLALFARVETTLMIFAGLGAFTLIVRRKFLRTVSLALLFLVCIGAFYGLYHGFNVARGYSQVTEQAVSMIFSSLSIRSAPTVAMDAPLNFHTYLPGLVLPGFLENFFAKVFPLLAFVGSLMTWLGWPLFLAILLALVLMFARRQLSRPELYLVFAAGFVFFPFAITGAGANWPRQISIALILLVLFLAAWLIRHWQERKFDLRFAFGGAFFGLLFAVVLPQVLFLERYRSALSWVGTVFALVFFAAIIFGVFFRHSSLLTHRLFVVLVGLFFVFSLVQIKHDLNVPYTLAAYYGNYGYKAAGQFIAAVSKPEEKVLVVDAVGYYSDRFFYDLTDVDTFDDDWDWIVVYEVPVGRYSDLVEDVALVARFGTVGVYRSDSGNINKLSQGLMISLDKT